MDLDVVKLFGTGGGFLVILGAFVWLIRTVGLSLVRSIEKIADKVDEHTKTDLQHHAEVKEAVVELRGEVRSAMDRRWDEMTPVETPKQRTPVRGVPTVYSHTRKPSQGDR